MKGMVFRCLYCLYFAATLLALASGCFFFCGHLVFCQAKGQRKGGLPVWLLWRLRFWQPFQLQGHLFISTGYLTGDIIQGIFCSITSFCRYKCCFYGWFIRNVIQLVRAGESVEDNMALSLMFFLVIAIVFHYMVERRDAKKAGFGEANEFAAVEKLY